MHRKLKNITAVVLLSTVLMSYTGCVTTRTEDPVKYEQQLLTVVDAAHIGTLAAVAAFPDLKDQSASIAFGLDVFAAFLAQDERPCLESLRAVSDALAVSCGIDKGIAFVSVYAGWLALQKFDEKVSGNDGVWRDYVGAVIVGMQRGLSEIKNRDVAQ